MKKLLLIILLPFVCSCANTSISSIAAPDHGTYKNFLIHAKYDDIESRSGYERELAFSLRAKGVLATKSMDVFSPLKHYKDTEMQEIIKHKGYDAILTLDPNGTSSATSTDVYTNWYGGVSATSNNFTSGIYTTANIYDTKTDENIYRASSSTSLGEYTTNSTAVASLADNLADDLDIHRFFDAETKKNANSLTRSGSHSNPFFTVIAIVGIASAAVFLTTLK